MPQARNVVLNYNPANPSAAFGPSPRRVPVAPGDTIRFRIGASTRAAHPNSKLRITFHDGRHFSNRVLEHSPNQTGEEDLVVSVRPGSPAALAAAAAAANNVITGYKCELLDSSGSPLPGLSSDGASGGEVVPDNN
jgi:hypothetical protein